MKKKGHSFKALFFLAAVVPMLIAAIIIGIMSVSSLTSSIKSGMRTELAVAAEQMAAYIGEEIATHGTIEYDDYADHTYIESMQKHDIELTIFQGDTRFLTSLKNEDGSYMEGTQASEEIYKQVSSGKDYNAENVVIGDEKYMVYYMPIYGGDGNFWGMSYAGKKESNVVGPIRTVVTKIIFVIFVLSILFLGVSLYLANKMGAVLVKTTKQLERLSEGHLDAEFDSESIVREFNAIVGAGSVLQQNLHSIIGKTKSVSLELKTGSDKVTKMAEYSQNGANQISAAMSDLAQGSMDMAESVQNISEQIGEIGTAVDNIFESTDKLVSMSSSMKNANDEAMEYMTQVSDSSEKSVGAVKDIAKQIDDTNTAVERIKSAVEMISSIASETNLLALNASIEAARAGDAGKGFAVVADEIKNLSEQTNESTLEIQEVVNEIVEKSERSVELSAEVAELIVKEQGYISDTKEKFNVLNGEIVGSIKEINSISDKVKVLNASKDTITGSVQDLGAISQENAASNEEVSASVEGIATSITSIAESSGVTNKIVDELVDTVGYFR